MSQTKKPLNVLNASITAIGGYVPDEILSNSQLETMVETNDAWIQDKTGIKERRILSDPQKATSYLAIKAADDLISKNNINPKNIDMIIDNLFPIIKIIPIKEINTKIVINLNKVSDICYTIPNFLFVFTC